MPDVWEDNWEDTTGIKCPRCGSGITLPKGKFTSKILIISFEPDEGDEIAGKVLSGVGGGVLESELDRAKIDKKSIRYTSIWQHLPNGNKECLDFGMRQAILESKNKKLILLMGAEAVKLFTDKSVEDYNGLVVQSDLLSCKNIIACIKPQSIFSGGVGEFRFAIQNFAKRIEELE